MNTLNSPKRKLLNIFFIQIRNEKFSIIIVFEIPFESLNTLKYFDNGLYSKYKLDDKKKILNFYSVTSSDKFVPAGVLYKKDWRKLEIEDTIGMSLPMEAELSSIPDINEETYFLKYKYVDEI